jgi:hypothetical protein
MTPALRASVDSRLYRWAGPPAQIQPDRATVAGCKQWKKRRVLSQVPASECARWIRTGNAPAARHIDEIARWSSMSNEERSRILHRVQPCANNCSNRCVARWPTTND